MLISCTEEFVIETQTFESVLVVEGTITDEFKQQEIKLSRTYPLEIEEQVFENNATVTVIDDLGNNYSFSQSNGSSYLSTIEFQAEPDRTYILEITTNNGKQYKSSPQQLTPASEIDNLYAELVDDPKNGLGIEVYVDSNNNNLDAKYYRYEYEETYKIVAPYYSPYEAILTNYEEVLVFPGPDIQVFYDIEFALRQSEEKTCFNTRKNTSIIQTTTSSLSDNTISRFPIRFINTNDGIIRDRYSILVKQYVQNLEAYTYYKTLNELGNNESILSENQPGYVAGNISHLTNDKEKVIGFFDVATISERRIYFNYFDFNLTQPDYIYECNIRELDFADNSTIDMDRNDKREIYRLLTTFEEENQDLTIVEVPPFIGGIWKLVNPECGDCTTVGSNIQPDFWEN